MSCAAAVPDGGKNMAEFFACWDGLPERSAHSLELGHGNQEILVAGTV